MKNQTTRAVVLATVLALPLKAQSPVTGQSVPELAALDSFMTSYIAKWQIPGGALAVTRNGELTYARGFGWSDRDRRESVQPDSIFRLASLSKPITAVAAMKLVEQGKLDLDAKAFDLIPEYIPNPLPARFDPRVRQVTVRQLLHHTGGWDRDASGSFDPMFRTTAAASATGTAAPAGCPAIIRYMMDFRLNFDPGQNYAYSNFGYCILGRIIEKVTGTTYEVFMLGALREMGVEQMRLGKTLLSQRLPGEVVYYPNAAEPNTGSVFPGGGTVSQPYGGFYMEALDAHGGWVGSAVDLVRFTNSVDGRRGFAFLSPASVAELLSRPPDPVSPGAAAWYAKGWLVRGVTGGSNWWHSGSLPGTQTYLVRLVNGIAWAAVFNMRPQAAGPSVDELEVGVNNTLAQVRTWPSHDLFTSFAPAGRPRIAASRGVENGASYTAGFTPGGWVQIKGAELAPGTRAWTAPDFQGEQLPTSLDGVEVRINGKPAAIYYISPEQINVQAPEDAASGRVWVQVSRSGTLSEPAPAEIRRNAPGLFQYGPEQTPLAVAVHPDARVVGDPAIVAGTVPAIRGQRILLYGSNFVTSPAGRTLSGPVEVSEPVRVTVGGVAVVVEYCGLISPGLFQVNLLLPEDTPVGNQEIVIEVNGVRSKPGVLLAVRGS